MDEVGSDKLGPERRDDICEENDALGDIWSDKVQGRGQEDNVEDIVDKACLAVRSLSFWISRRLYAPNTQKATQTRGSAPLKTPFRRSLNRIHRDDEVSSSPMGTLVDAGRVIWKVVA